MKNFKKFITMALLAAMMIVPLAGCGGGSDADVADDEVTTDVAEISDETFDALQSQYSALVDVYNIIKDAHESGTVTLSDEQLAVFNEAADVINDMGELEMADFADEDEAVELSETIADLAQGLSDIYDEAAAAGEIPEAAEGVSDETFTAVQESYSALVDLYNTVKTAVESGAVTPTAEQTESINQVADIINEMGDIEKSDFATEQDAIDLLESMSTLADVLGSVAE